MRSPRIESRPPGALTVLRHALVTPILGLLLLALIVASPAFLVAASLLSLAVDRSHWRPLRGTALLTVYAGCEIAVLGGALALLLRPGNAADGRQAGHLRLLRWALERFGRAAERLLRLRVTVEGEEGAERAVRARHRPLVVLSRHHGPGDPFMVVRYLVEAGRWPRVVLRSAMRLDPAVDVLGSRLSLCFIRRGGAGKDAALQGIRDLSAGMGPGDALLLFPEGGNVTPERRRRGVERLLRLGWRRRARQAAHLRSLAAPHPRGALVALEANPGADVLLLAHTGLAGMDAIPWRRVPVDCAVLCHLWLVRAEEVPSGQSARTEWLFDWWRRLDRWVIESTGPPATP